MGPRFAILSRALKPAVQRRARGGQLAGLWKATFDHLSSFLGLLRRRQFDDSITKKIFRSRCSTADPPEHRLVWQADKRRYLKRRFSTAVG